MAGPVQLPPVARFGLACGALALPVGRAGRFLNELEPELGRRFAVRLGDGGRSLTAATRGNGPDFVARAAQFVSEAEPAHAQAVLALFGPPGGPTTVEVRLGGRGVEVALEQVRGGPVDQVLVPLAAGPAPLLPGAQARELAEVARLLRTSCDAVGWTRHQGEVSTRLVFAEADPGPAHGRVLKVLELMAVPAERRAFVAGTWGPLTANGGVVIRLGTGAQGVDSLAVEYRNVAAKNALGVWQTLAPDAALPRLLGSLVAVLGRELVAALEVTHRRDGATVVATFELGAEPVTLPIRPPSPLGHFAD